MTVRESAKKRFAQPTMVQERVKGFFAGYTKNGGVNTPYEGGGIPPPFHD